MHVFKHQIVTTAIYAHRGRSASHWLVWKPVVQFRWFCSLHRFRTRFILTSLKYDDDAYDNEKKVCGSVWYRIDYALTLSIFQIDGWIMPKKKWKWWEETERTICDYWLYSVSSFEIQCCCCLFISSRFLPLNVEPAEVYQDKKVHIFFSVTSQARSVPFFHILSYSLLRV